MKPRMSKPKPPKPRPRPTAYPRPHPDLLPPKPPKRYGSVASARMENPKRPNGGSGNSGNSGSSGGLGKGFYKGVAVGSASAIGAREISDYDGRSDKNQNYWQWNKGGRK